MGTNYYTKDKITECECCGSLGKIIHLGKSSHGWQFSFQYNGGEYYKNVEEMKDWLKGKTIKNEYGEVTSVEDFFKMVEIKQTFKNNHAEKYPGATERVINGYSFTDCEFS